MAKFNGKNDLYLTRDLIIERTRYSVEAYEDLLTAFGPKNIVDFNFAERGKYGRVDYNGNPIIPLSSKLKAVPSSGGSGNTVLLMNFVADAFIDLRDRMRSACTTGIIPFDHPFLSALEAERAYTPAIKMYDDYIVTLLGTYNQTFIGTMPDKGKIITFEDYVSYFEKFVAHMGPHFPVTFTGWYRSKYSSIFSSGLVVDIAGLPIDDDAPKADTFIDSRLWDYYSKASTYHGFSIAKNAPWVLVADLASPTMQSYMERYQLNGIQKTFDRQFIKVLSIELDRLDTALLQSYNNFVRANPYHKDFYICKDYTTKQTIHRRQIINSTMMRKKLSNIRLFTMYTKIRNVEEGSPFKTADMKRILQKLNVFYQKLGSKKALEYVNEQFRSLYKFKTGSAIDIQRRQAARRELLEEDALREENITGATQSAADSLTLGAQGPSTGGGGSTGGGY
mgnify:CR=1 FL=1